MTDLTGAIGRAPDTVITNGTNRADHVKVTRSGSRILTAGLGADEHRRQ